MTTDDPTKPGRAASSDGGPRNGNHSELAYRELKARIIQNSLRPGERLIEAQLAEDIGVSRTPVREALRRLITEQLISRDASGALIVHAPTQREVDEIYQIREALEGLAAGLAAQRISDAELERARYAVDALREASQAGNTNSVIYANIMFHDILYEATRNERLIQLGREMRDFVRLYSREAFTRSGRTDSLTAEHEAILDALKNRDSDEAESAARLHIRRAREHMIRAQLFAGLDGDLA